MKPSVDFTDLSVPDGLFDLPYNRAVVVQKKSSLLLKIFVTNTQTLQLSTKIIKTQIIYKSYYKC